MKRLAILLLLPLTFSVLGFAQTPLLNSSAPRTELEEKRNAEHLKRDRIISLVEQTANEAVFWDDRQAAVVVLIEASDLLWDESENAPAWLIRAWDLVKKVDDGENAGELRQLWRGSRRSSLQTRILTVARARDPQLAERFLRSLDANKIDDKSERGVFDDRTARSEQLLRLALAAIDANPAIALGLAERSLQDGISFNLQTVLLRLRQKDPELANYLFDAALARIANSESTFRESQILGSYLFKPGEVLMQLPSGVTSVAVVQTHLLPQTPAEADPARARRFLSAVQRMLLSAPLPMEEQNPQAGEFVLLATSLAHPFEIYAPEMWPPIQSRSGQFAAKLPARATSPNSSAAEAIKAAARSGASAEELNRLQVAALEREAEAQSNPIARKLKFAEAALATQPKDFDYGKRLSGRIENDDELRDQVTAFLSYRAALTFLMEKDLKHAEEAALLIPISSERALALIAVAQKIAAVKPQSDEGAAHAETNRQRAIELLFEADKSLRREGGSAQVAKIRLGKIAVSNLVDVTQAFSDFEQAIAAINRLDKFDPTDGSAPRFGIEGFRTSNLTVPRLEFGFGLRNALEPLVKADFDLAAATIERLTSPSVRGSCRLEIARQALPSLPRPVSLRTALGKSQPAQPH